MRATEPAAVAARLQGLLARINAADAGVAVGSYLLTDLGALGPAAAQAAATGETLFLRECADGVELALYVDAAVLARLARRDPLRRLDERNLQDYCTLAEGLSHLNYVAWRAAHGRPVSLLELELQAEVDKFALALALLGAQGGVDAEALHARLFARVRFHEALEAEARARYETANRLAARLCARLLRRCLRGPRASLGAWYGALREFYRLGHPHKLRAAA